MAFLESLGSSVAVVREVEELDVMVDSVNVVDTEEEVDVDTVDDVVLVTVVVKHCTVLAAHLPSEAINKHIVPTPTSHLHSPNIPKSQSLHLGTAYSLVVTVEVVVCVVDMHET
jgi:hypothetical protein